MGVLMLYMYMKQDTGGGADEDQGTGGSLLP